MISATLSSILWSTLSTLPTGKRCDGTLQLLSLKGPAKALPRAGLYGNYLSTCISLCRKRLDIADNIDFLTDLARFLRDDRGNAFSLELPKTCRIVGFAFHVE
jgi:hypothetical protein